jgi:branched-chain amino acid transport system permease protein
MGLANISPLPTILGERTLLLFAVLLPLIIAALSLPRTMFGARVRAVRDDEPLSEDLRLRPGQVRIALFIGSASIFTFLGGLYVHHLRFVDPSSFALRESIAVLAMAFLVPIRSPLKGLVGGVLFVALPEVLRFVGLPSSMAAQLRQALFGFLLLVVVCTRPIVFRREALSSGGPNA